MFDWGELKRWLSDLKARIDSKPGLRWATVTSSKPLRIRFDGEEAELLGAPSTTVRGLQVGERVRVEVQNQRVTVIGRAGSKPQKVLWTGAWYMHGSQTASLSERVSEQENGIILIWQKYTNNTPSPTDIHATHIPKWGVQALPGRGWACVIADSLTNVNLYQKYVYVHDDKIMGNEANGVAPRATHVLTAVLGY